MISIKRHNTGAARSDGVVWISKPYPEVVHLDWRIAKQEGFLTEDSGEVRDAAAVVVGLNLPLVPRKAKGSLPVLSNEGGGRGSGGKSERLNVHVLNGTQVIDGNPSTGGISAAGGAGGRVPC